MKNLPVQNARQAGQKAYQTSTASAGALPGNSFMSTSKGAQRFPGRKTVPVQPGQKSTQAPELAQRINSEQLSEARIRGYRTRIEKLAQQADSETIVNEYNQILTEARNQQDSLAEETMKNDLDLFLNNQNDLMQGMG
tara:strand:+ start:217 stop:630 length:414 start_codon:yes stop_codon:yes gene_type:complete